MIDFCRACLMHKSQLVSLADSRNDTPILDMLASVCGIHFKKSHRFSHAICVSCLDKLDLAHTVAQEFRDQEMLLRSLWQAEAWLVRLEEYQNMAREEPRSDRLLKGLTASINQQEESGTDMAVEIMEETTAETVVKEELIIEDELDVPWENVAPCQEQEVEEKPCSPQAPITDAVLEEEPVENEKPHESQDNQPDNGLPANSRYWCNKCKRKLSSRTAYLNHLKKHGQFQQHNWMLNNEQKRTCAHCKREFPDARCFQSHVSWHNRRGLLCCSTCGENQVTTESLKNHICPMAPKKMKHSRPARFKYRCEECDEMFAKKKNYVIHRKRHDIIRKGLYKCNICFEHLGGKDHLRYHMREHKSGYRRACKECGMVFTSGNAYSCHVFRHKQDQDGSFKCPKCEKTFLTLARLTNHKCNALEQSNEEEILVCAETVLKDASIVESSNQTSSKVMEKEEKCLEENSLTTAKKEPIVENNIELEPSIALTTNDNNALFECKECGRQFFQEKSYQNHVKRHENLRTTKFQCNICQLYLNGERALRSHKQKIHKPEPKWKQNCEECGRKFANANSYHCHMMRHRHVLSGKYQCTACGKCMTQQKLLIEHKCCDEGKAKKRLCYQEKITGNVIKSD